MRKGKGFAGNSILAVSTVQNSPYRGLTVRLITYVKEIKCIGVGVTSPIGRNIKSFCASSLLMYSFTSPEYTRGN